MKKPIKKPRPNFPNVRKAMRKQKRLEKKIKRVEHYSNKKKTNDAKQNFMPGQFVKRPAESIGEEGKTKPKKQKHQQPTLHEIVNKERLKEKKETDKLKSEMEEQRRKLLLDANEDEDKLIKKLEKQLGLKKTKNKNNFFSDDGLDYLLEICDRSTTEQIVAAEKHLANVEDGSDFEEDLAMVTGKDTEKTKEKKKTKQKINDDSENDNDSDVGDDDESLGSEGSGEEDEDDGGLSSLEEESDIGEVEEGDEEDGDLSDEQESEDEDGSEGEVECEEDDDEPPKKAAKKSNHEIKAKSNKKESSSKIKEKAEDSDELSANDFDTGLSDDEVSHLSGDDDENEANGDAIKEIKEKPDVWEDIYGRKRDKDGNIIKEEKGVYIPPHLRNKDSITDKELVQLKRQIKSVLNKLSGQNLHWACTTIENLYSHNSRNSVNTALTDLWLQATVAPSATSDRMVAEHAALIAVLQANVGNEVGAHFLQVLAKQFDDMMTSEPAPISDKTLDNLVSCLSHLYSFKLYQANLLYDILGRLVAEVSERTVSSVLVALRAVGGALRREEPLALKAFIHGAQARAAALHHDVGQGSRIKVLLEVLMAVKNNNLNKIPNYDPSYTEQLKKSVKIIIRKGNYITPLNIRLEDLLKADERGKWWVVGSAWEGNRVRQQESKEEKAVVGATDQKLLELARRQRMNTDVRRSIFCIIMGAEDYMDAFEKLQHLGLKGQQEREVVHVLLACCLQEKAYNQYYALLGQKMCDHDRKYQLSIQYAVWDKIKDIENQSKLCLSNLAQFLTHLVMEKGLPLSVLKIIQFSDLNKSSVRFMRQILLAIIMNDDLQTALEVFHRISKSPKLHMFRESLRLFIQHFLMKNTGKKTNVLKDSEMQVLKQRTLEVDKILTSHDSKLRL